MDEDIVSGLLEYWWVFAITVGPLILVMIYMFALESLTKRFGETTLAILGIEIAHRDEAFCIFLFYNDETACEEYLNYLRTVTDRVRSALVDPDQSLSDEAKRFVELLNKAIDDFNLVSELGLDPAEIPADFLDDGRKVLIHRFWYLEESERRRLGPIDDRVMVIATLRGHVEPIAINQTRGLTCIEEADRASKA